MKNKAAGANMNTNTPDAYERALRYLEHRPHTVAEVHRYLREKEYEDTEIAEAVERLLEYRYLDDEQYARDYILYAMNKRRAWPRILRELGEKGVNRAAAEEARYALEEQEGIDFDAKEWENALEEGRRAGKGGPLDEKGRARIGRRLASLGYSASMIYAVLDQLSRS